MSKMIVLSMYMGDMNPTNRDGTTLGLRGAMPPHPQILFFFFFKYYIYTYIFVLIRDDNFAPPHPALTRPASLCLVRVFSAPQRWWGGDGTIFCPRTPGWGRDEFSIFIPNPPCPIPTPH